MTWNKEDDFEEFWKVCFNVMLHSISGKDVGPNADTIKQIADKADLATEEYRKRFEKEVE